MPGCSWLRPTWARISAKSREQVEYLLNKQPNHAPTLRLLFIDYLVEGDSTAAKAYLKLKAVAPAATVLPEQGLPKAGPGRPADGDETGW